MMSVEQKDFEMHNAAGGVSMLWCFFLIIQKFSMSFFKFQVKEITSKMTGLCQINVAVVDSGVRHSMCPCETYSCFVQDRPGGMYISTLSCYIVLFL